MRVSLMLVFLFLSGCVSLDTVSERFGYGLGAGVGEKLSPELESVVAEAGNQARQTLVDLQGRVVRDLNETLLPQIFAELRVTLAELSEKGQEDLARLVIPALLDRLNLTIRNEIRPMLVELVELIINKTDEKVASLEEKLVSDIESRILPEVWSGVECILESLVVNVEEIRGRSFQDIRVIQERLGEQISEQRTLAKDDAKELIDHALNKSQQTGHELTREFVVVACITIVVIGITVVEVAWKLRRMKVERDRALAQAKALSQLGARALAPSVGEMELDIESETSGIKRL